MLLGFKKQFVPFILDGSKTHTIRAPRKTSPRVGETCHCYTNVRQKNMTLLGRWPCVRVEPVTLDFAKHGIAYTLRITISDQTLSLDEASAFAWRDGFRTGFRNEIRSEKTQYLDEMARFWIADGRLKDDIESKPWHGQVIHWAYKVPA